MLKKTLSRFTSTFAALLTDQSTIIDADGRTENIRNAMLRALSTLEDHHQNDALKVWSDIVRADDIQALWYLRSDVLRLLADFGGESVARKKLDEISEMFRGMVPDNQMPTARRTIRS
ncbi:MAG: hypothetical protein WCH60_01610 [Burkholderiales bacterium]